MTAGSAIGAELARMGLLIGAAFFAITVVLPSLLAIAASAGR